MSNKRVAIIGGGPAGLMAAERVRAAGFEVDLFEQKGSVGRKFLLAGKGGLNLTHSEPAANFTRRFRERSAPVSKWLDAFSPSDLIAWVQAMGIETMIGSSGRVFPADLRAAPLLRGWVRRLRAQGVRFHMHHRLSGWATTSDHKFSLQFAGEQTTTNAQTVDALILALGGGSWPQLGSDGNWALWLANHGIELAPLQASNCGFDVPWSTHFLERFAGAAIKPISMSWQGADQTRKTNRGELIVTANGFEGGLIYQASPDLRDQCRAHGKAIIEIDLLPNHSPTAITAALEANSGRRSLSEVLRRKLKLDGARAGLVYEFASTAQRGDAADLGNILKALPITLLRPRPLSEAISSAGGVRLEALDSGLMSTRCAGTFFAGEMLDWEAPTGGYLLTACFASGVVAADAAISWLRN